MALTREQLEFQIAWPRPRLIAELKKKCSVDFGVQKAFSPKAIGDLGALITDSSLVDLDILLLEDGVQDEALVEYAAFLPEYQETRRRLVEIGQRMMGFLAPGVEKALNQGFSSNEVTIFGPLMEQYKLSHKLCSSLSARDIPAFFRREVLGQLNEYLFAQTTYQVHRSLARRQKSDPRRYFQERVKEFLTVYPRHFTGVYQRGLPGDTFHAHSTRAIKSIRELHPESFRDLVSQPGSEKPDQELEREANEKFALMREMAPVIHFDSYLKQWRLARLGIYGLSDKITGHSKAEIMYQFRLILNPEYKHKRTTANISIDHRDITINHTQWADSFFDFHLDYFTGEIYLQKHLPLASILSPREYLQVKNAVFDAVLECLDDKTKKLDRQSLLPPPIEAEIALTHGQIAAGLPANTVEEGPDPEPARKSRPEPDGNAYVYRRALRGKKCDRVLRALISILGEPKANNGSSHYIFTSKDGKTMSPISIHGNHLDMKVGAIVTILDRLGITYKEFLENY